MSEFLTAILSFPTVVFTVMLFVVVLYWLMVIVGAIGVDVLNIGDLDVEVEVEGAAPGSAGGGGFLAMLGFGKVPATVVFSSLALWSWALCLLAVRFGVQIGLPGWSLQMAAPLVGVFLGGILTGLLVRTIARFLVHHEPLRSSALVGRMCTITTGRVDANFGQAQFSEQGDVITIDVRCDPPNSLQRHAQAVIIAYHPEHHTYTVEAYEQPMTPLGERSSSV